MPQLVQRTWPADPHAPGARKERQSFRYMAFVPDPVGQLQLALSAQIAGIVSAAERQLALLNRPPPAMASLRLLAPRLLRAERGPSSRIEGLVPSLPRLAEAPMAPAQP